MCRPAGAIARRQSWLGTYCPEEKIDLIPHGIPDLPFGDPNYYKDSSGTEGKAVLLTFGLLSPNKGIESVIEAMPRIVAQHPEAVYVIVGATHPHIRRREGDQYRLQLQFLARKRGVERNVIFHNRFVSSEEMAQFVGSADIYITPYRHLLAAVLEYHWPSRRTSTLLSDMA